MTTSAGTAALSERRRLRLSLLLQILSVCAFLALWSAATEYGWVSTIFLPSPRAVAAEAGKLVGTGELWQAMLASSRRVFLGFALAELLGLMAFTVALLILFVF